MCALCQAVQYATCRCLLPAGYNAGETPLPPTPTNLQVSSNVMTYGAVGDGVTNDIDAFAAAVAAQPTGGVVYIPPGKYLLSSQLLITRRVSLVGAGPRQTTIIQDWAAADVKLIEYAGAVLNSSVRSQTRIARIPTQAFRGASVLNMRVRRWRCCKPRWWPG